jgi:L-lactate dehydrogenase complex protein LldG
MSATRDAILANLRKAHGERREIPPYLLPPFVNDLAGQFIVKARAAVAEVREIAAVEDAPAAIQAILAAAGLPSRIHVPSCSPLRELPWEKAPDLMLSDRAPTKDDAAFSAADYAVAETGTLAFFSGSRSLSSWHFRPGREIVLLLRSCILPRLEDVIGLLRAGRQMPATMNLVTGPSRTADIEQTIELGAHGPCATHILIVG